MLIPNNGILKLISWLTDDRAAHFWELVIDAFFFVVDFFWFSGRARRRRTAGRPVSGTPSRTPPVRRLTRSHVGAADDEVWDLPAQRDRWTAIPRILPEMSTRALVLILPKFNYTNALKLVLIIANVLLSRSIIY